MAKLRTAYYVTYTFGDKPFFVGPYATIERAESAYMLSKGEPDLQLLKVEVIK